MPRLLTALAALLAVLLIGSAPAHASTSQGLVFDGGRDLGDAATRPAALDELQSLGVRSLRVVVYWRDVAPAPTARARPAGDLADPAAYDWSRYDGLMAAASERGMSVLMTPTLPGPKWAMKGRKDFLTRPSAKEFERFMQALAVRYGEQVATWAIGNEPNHPDFLRPQYSGGEAISPRLYRGLFQAADRALDRTGNSADALLLGEMLPRGRRGRSVAPLAFLRGVLCLDRSYRKLRSRRCGRLDADGVSHHPYTTSAGPYFVSPNRDDVTIGTLGRLTSALDRAARTGAIRPRMPIWLTEFGIQSTPDRFAGVSLARQTQYRAIAERIAYTNPRVRMFSQYLLRDDAPVEGVSAAQRYQNFETGLRFATGRPKPSLDGFRLTLAGLRKGRVVSLWGLIRPAAAATTADVLVQDRGAKTFRLLRTVRTDGRGYLSLRTTFRKGRKYRLRWQDALGAPVQAYKR